MCGCRVRVCCRCTTRMRKWYGSSFTLPKTRSSAQVREPCNKMCRLLQPRSTYYTRQHTHPCQYVRATHDVHCTTPLNETKNVLGSSLTSGTFARAVLNSLNRSTQRECLPIDSTCKLGSSSNENQTLVVHRGVSV